MLISAPLPSALAVIHAVHGEVSQRQEASPFASTGPCLVQAIANAQVRSQSIDPLGLGSS